MENEKWDKYEKWKEKKLNIEREYFSVRYRTSEWKHIKVKLKCMPTWKTRDDTHVKMYKMKFMIERPIRTFLFISFFNWRHRNSVVNSKWRIF